MADSEKPALNCLSLCSGVGMLDEGLGFALEYFGVRHNTVAYAEWEGYPAQQLVALMEAGALDTAPVWCGDFADLDWKAFYGVVDAFVAGYPCQAWSTAGKRRGFADKRWVWGHIEHGLSIIQPRFIFLENVRGLISGGGLGATIEGLSRLGYDTEWVTLYASSVGAAHQRDRVFIFGHRGAVGHTDGSAESTLLRRKHPVSGQSSSAGNKVAHAKRTTRSGIGDERRFTGKIRKRFTANKSDDREDVPLFAPWQDYDGWDEIQRVLPQLVPSIKSDVRELVDGLASILGPRFVRDNEGGGRKLARKNKDTSAYDIAVVETLYLEAARSLRCSGNGVVPQQAAVAYMALMKRAGFKPVY